MELRDPLTEQIIGAAIDVHRVLGPGLLESAYEECLCHELRLRQLSFKRQVEIPIKYKEVTLDCGYRIDVVVSEEVLVELKVVDRIHPIHEAQLLTYMRLAKLSTGLILNFNVAVLKDGILRRKL